MPASKSPGTRRTGRRLPKAPPEAFRKVGDEVLRQDFDPECWAQALAISDGGKEETVAHYARIRTKALAQRLKGDEAKKKNLEKRQRGAYKPLTELPKAAEVSWQETVGWRGVWDSLFWHGVAALGVVGCLLAVGALWPSFQMSMTWGMILWVAVALQAVPALGWWAGRGFLDSFSYPGAVQLSATFAVAASIALGSYLLARPEKVSEAWSEVGQGVDVRPESPESRELIVPLQGTEEKVAMGDGQADDPLGR